MPAVWLTYATSCRCSLRDLPHVIARRPYDRAMRLLRSPRSITAVAAAAVLAVAAVACSPEEKAEDKTGDVADADQCAVEDLALKQDGVLTIGTDSPAYDPWFSDNDPTNGKGFESAVAYAVAEEMGFEKSDVKWIKVGFNSLAKPGDKDFDFDINQVSISPERDEVVDFSEGYYSAAQAVIALKGSAAADATTLEELEGLKLGAQTGTTSLTAIRETIQPDQDPAVLDDTNVAKQQLQNGTLDAIVADLPTALYISAVEIPDSTLVGQFQVAAGQTEEFGLLFQQGSELLPCVNLAIQNLKEDGTLAAIEEKWLGADVVSVPELK
jgi:polar amino acid transport system substrate-binding protein